MVSIHKPQQGGLFHRLLQNKLWMGIGGVWILCYVVWSSFPSQDQHLRAERVDRPDRPASIQVQMDEATWDHEKANKKSVCRYNSLEDLTEEELQPSYGDRHMKTPPMGGKVSLVCCDTTAGPLTIVAHHTWAPLGAQRFLDMVTSGYFNSGVPFMRCVKEFLCQFGLNADVSKKKEFQKTIGDDPNWLPEGKEHRENKNGVKRFAKGYLAYAGSGEHSRSKQLIMALKPNGPLAGGSPWEVPWGELVGAESFQSLDKIYTGYGEKGPAQGKLGNQGATDVMRAEFPLLDYINSCELLDERIQEEPLVEPGSD